MRWILPLLTGAWSLVLSARALMAQNHEKAWSVTVTTSLTEFRGAATDTSASGSMTVRPGQGITLGMSVTRRLGPWGVSVGLSHLPTHVEAMSTTIAVQDRTTGLGRARLTLAVSRRVMRVGAGALELRAGPTLDHWSVDDEESDGRTVGGGEAALALSLPAGPVLIENTLGFGWSAGPFRTEELPAGYRRQALRVVTAGLGIRFRL